MATSNNSNSSSTANAAAAASKKGKMKGKTVQLEEFLNKPINWAEEMEGESLTPADPDHSTGYVDETRAEIQQKRTQLPSGPKAAFSEGAQVDVSRVPTEPPFSAYMGNMNYEVSDDDLVRFFRPSKVISVRLMKEGGRSKGYGYVEFETREDLIEALHLNRQKLLGREVKIDLASRPEENQRGSSYGGRGGRQQRTGGGYERAGGGYNSERNRDRDSGRDREEETSGNWRNDSQPTAAPTTQYNNDRQPQSRPMAPPPPPAATGPPNDGYGYQAQNYGSAAPYSGAPHGGAPPAYGRDYSQSQYTRPSGYESDYGYGPGYEQQYPMMRQTSYSSTHSGYASEREGGAGGGYRRGGQPASAGYYGSMRRGEYRSSDRRQPMGGDRYAGDGYGGQAYQQDYPPQDAYYQGGGGGYVASGPRDSFRQQRSRGGYDNNRGGPQRDSYSGYEKPQYGAGRRSDDRLSSTDTNDGNNAPNNQPKERQRLALQPRSKPLPATEEPTTPIEGHGPEDTIEEQQQEQQPASIARPRTSASAAEVFGGARPVDTAARERQIEERLLKEKEEFRRRQEEEQQQKQQQQQTKQDLRKSSSSNFVPERMKGRRRTSDSQSSTGGALKSSQDAPIRGSLDDEDHTTGQQVKILQRAHTIASENPPERQWNESQPAQDRREASAPRSQPNAAAAPTPNFWANNQNRRPRNNQDEASGASGTVSSKTVQVSAADGERDDDVPSNISDRHIAGSQSKSSEADQEARHEEDPVFKSNSPRNPNPPHGNQRGRGRGGRGGGGHYQSHYADQSALPPRFARERDQHQQQIRRSSQTEDDQYQTDKRRPSKEIVIRRGGQGTLSPSSGGGVRRGGGNPSAPTRQPHQQRTGSREREYQQRGNGRRPIPNQQQDQRRGSADSGLPLTQQPDDQAAQKPPAGPRRQQQSNAPGSRKSSATPAAPAADAPPVSFESKNKFEMLNMDED